MAHRTALVLLAPNADVALRDLRERYFRSLERRMPAHVTMLFPFRSTIDEPTAAEISDICSAISPFTASWHQAELFRRDVVWLRPEPASAFDVMSAVIRDAFPDCPPYGGAHSTHTPHLTVASGLRGGQSDELLEQVPAVLPITENIDRLTLMAEHGAGWQVARTWPLDG